jgi:hypothetical protein
MISQGRIHESDPRGNTTKAERVLEMEKRWKVRSVSDDKQTKW